MSAMRRITGWGEDRVYALAIGCSRSAFMGITRLKLVAVGDLVAVRRLVSAGSPIAAVGVKPESRRREALWIFNP